MEEIKKILLMIGKGLWWLLQKLLLVVGAILQAFGNWLADNSKHK